MIKIPWPQYKLWGFFVFVSYLAAVIDRNSISKIHDLDF